MFFFKSGGKAAKTEAIIKQINSGVNPESLGSSYEENLKILRELFRDDDAMQFRNFRNNRNEKLAFCAIFCDGLVDSAIINEHVLKPLMISELSADGDKAADVLMKETIQINGAKKANDVEEIIKGLTSGDTLLLIDNCSAALLLSTKRFEVRSVTEPDGEKVISGPREGFSESMVTNLSLLRRKLHTNQLKMKYHTLGERSKTQICVAYIDTLVNKKILQELWKRLGKIDIDAVLDSNYINEKIKDNSLSLFRTTGSTERPDVVAAKLLEGRIAVFVDGTPAVLTVPYLFIENFQSNEDYYLNFYYASFSRVLRVIGFILAIVILGLYISIESYHQEILPAPLMISIAIERRAVPMPAAVEAFILIIAFDILRETGVRMPSNIGQALSIVGALVVGQAAVMAKLVAAPMIIIIALSGITSLLIPKLSTPVIFMRLGVLILASSFGLIGLIAALAVILIHILGLQSFGVSQMTPDLKLREQRIKDTVIRAPWWNMLTRPLFARDAVRQKSSEEEL